MKGNGCWGPARMGDVGILVPNQALRLIRHISGRLPCWREATVWRLGDASILPGTLEEHVDHYDDGAKRTEPPAHGRPKHPGDCGVYARTIVVPAVNSGS